MTFTPPDFAVGPGMLFKISASDVANRSSGFTCPMGLSLKARAKTGSLRPNSTDRWRPVWDNASTLTFALRTGLARVVRGDAVADIIDGEAHLTHAQRRFLRHALDLLQHLLPDAAEAAGVAYELDEVDFSTATSTDNPLRGTVTVWAHHLRSPDNRVHEAVRIRLKQLRPPREFDLDWTATAALVMAYDSSVPPDARLRISEFSLHDGELRCVFDGSRAEAARLYQQREQPLWPALDGTVFRPGSQCSGCAFLQVCPAVPQRRGVLGIPGRSVATRHLTAADLSAYDRCPTAFLAQRRDHLPDGYANDADGDLSAEARGRGLAVHAWLDWAHSRTPPRGCTAEDLPTPDSTGADDVAAASGLDPDSYRVAYPYLVQHLPHCPMSLDGLYDWASERRVVVYDADADIVVISTPDLTCRTGDTNDPIWRETKTSATIPPDVHAAMHKYPAFALNVALLQAEVPTRAASVHAELEVLTPHSAEVFYVSATDGATVAYAQQLLAGIARRFAADLSFDRKPSGVCPGCSSHRWCDPPATGASQLPTPEIDDAEFADFEDPF